MIIGRSSRVLHENIGSDGRVKSKINVVDNRKSPTHTEPGQVLLPKYLAVLGGLGLVSIAIILTSAITVVVFAPRPGFYNESCSNRSCLSSLNMKCINKTCLCTAEQYYEKKCIDKKGYMEKCGSSVTRCKNEKNFICRDGVCKCTDDKYYDGYSCVQRRNYSQSCNYDEQCVDDKFLICDSTTNKCSCPSNRFWDTYSCPVRRTYSEVCKDSNYCDNSKHLICVNKQCVCNSTTYWDHIFLTCAVRKKDNETCFDSYQCWTPMNCSNGLCTCGKNNYFDYINWTCKMQTTINTTCIATSNCRVDLGLDCINGKCICNESNYKWSTERNICILPKTYTEQTCTYDSDCENDKNDLICNYGSQCNCPSNSIYRMCDCMRNKTREYFWNGTNCQLALTNGSSCSNASTTYMCKWITEGTICNNTGGIYTCQCPPLMYFETSVGYCKNQTLHDTSCSISLSCRVDLGLSCQGNKCLCNSTSQFWLTTTSICTNYYPYTDNRCFADYQCASTLICNNSTNTKCNCPVALNSGTCDCPRTYGNETYWNGQLCIQALTKGSSCSNASTTYMCKWITEGTICNNTGGIHTCQCPPLMYFETSVGYCKNQALHNTSCSISLSCRGDLGLICQMGNCVCNSSIQFWSTSSQKCLNYYTYGQSGCFHDFECGFSLICNTANSTRCNCPSNLTVSTCDCVRKNGSEYYWDGTRCASAKSFNQSCTNGSLSNNYMCQTITQNTYCDSVSKLCFCGPSGGFDIVTNRCVYCATGWTYFNGKCYFVSTTTFYSSADIFFNHSSVYSACNNNNSATLAVIKDVATLNYIRSITINTTYWIGAQSHTLSCPGGVQPSNIYTSDDGTWNLGSTIIPWCTGNPTSKSGSDCPNCGGYDRANNCFVSNFCVKTLYRVICQV